MTREQKEAKRVIELLIDYIGHKNNCIRSHFGAGEPTKNGGYRMNFRGKWYQAKPIDKTPECECGLSDLLKSFESLN